MDTLVKPSFVTDSQLDYLDTLRDSGVTNMFGATPYIREEYPELTKQEARQVLSYWMQTFPRK